MGYVTKTVLINIIKIIATNFGIFYLNCLFKESYIHESGNDIVHFFMYKGLRVKPLNCSN